MICSLYAYYGLKSKGGKKALGLIAKDATMKKQHIANIKAFIDGVLAGKLDSWSEAGVMSEVSTSSQKSLLVEEYWDFQTLEYFRAAEKEVDEAQLVEFFTKGRSGRGNGYAPPRPCPSLTASESWTGKARLLR